jgi:mercuric ion binding protein
MRYRVSAVVIAAMLWGGAAFAAERTVTLAVDNMTCATCGPIVKASLGRIAGVRQVVVSPAEQTATVTFDDALASTEILVAATTNAGYPSRPAARP